MTSSMLTLFERFLPFATDTLIKATVLLVVVTIAAHLMRRRSAAARHLLWTLGIAGLVAIPVLTAFVPFRLRILPTSPSSTQQDGDPAIARPAAPRQQLADAD